MRTNITTGTFQRLFKQKVKFLWKNCDILDCFLGTKVTTLTCGWSKLSSKQIKLVWMFASFKSRWHTKTIFVPKVRLFSISLLVCEFNPHRQTWNMVPKIYGDLSALEKLMPPLFQLSKVSWPHSFIGKIIFKTFCSHHISTVYHTPLVIVIHFRWKNIINWHATNSTVLVRIHDLISRFSFSCYMNLMHLSKFKFIPQ